jgi:DNA-binding transcriptional LysR family regulator
LVAEYILLHKIPSLHELNPQLGVEIRINDRIGNLATESVDIVARGGVAPADTMEV